MTSRQNCSYLAPFLGFLLLITHALSWSAAAPLTGRTVVEVIESLRSAQLQFIYSSGVLTGSERILSEPHAKDALGLAREVLAPYGLGLSVVTPGVYAIVRQASQPAIRGRVFDRATGRGLPGVRIELLPSRSVHWSDSQGRFVLATARAGAYRLYIKAESYVAVEVEATAVDSNTPSLSVALESAPPGLAELVVTASRYAVGQSASMGSVLLEGSQLAAQPSLGDDSIRALARLPGMSQSGYSAQSNVRGGEPGEVLLLLDGFPLRQAFHLPGYQSFFSAVDPGIIDEAEVYTGGFPVRYGNRLSGVFDLHTVEAPALDQAVGLSFFNAMARGSGQFAALDGNWLAVARVGTLKPLLNMFAPDAGNPSYSDVYARAAIESSDGLRVTGNMLWSRDELGAADVDRGERAEIESLSRYIWVRADKKWEPGLAASVWLGQSRIDSKRLGSVSQPFVAQGAVSDSRASQLWDLRTRVTWQAGERNWFEGGAEWTRESADYRYRANVEYTQQIAMLFARDTALARLADLDLERDRLGLFAAHRWRVTTGLTSEIGLRTQRILTKGSNREWIYDPRVSLRWQLGARTSLRAHWGRFHQADEIQELKVEDGLLNFPRAQRADHIIGGIEHQLANGIEVRLEAFSKHQSTPRPRFENTLDPLAFLPEVAPDRVLVLPNYSESRGVEVSGAYARREWTAWTSLTWSKVEDEVDGREVPRSWDQTWAVTAGVQWERGPWQLGAVANVHRGWPTTLLVDGAAGPTLQERNRSRLSSYATLDARAAYQSALNSGRLTFAFEVANLFNRHNACCSQLVVTPDATGSTTIRTEPLHWLPLVPSLSVLWEF